MGDRKEPKRKFALWIRDSTIEQAKELYQEDNCSSVSEFIEKAVIFYAGYLSSQNNSAYLPSVITSTLKGIVAESDNRQNQLLFKIAVELAMTMNVLASMQQVDASTLRRLRGACVQEVKRINGTMTFNTAAEWQHE